MYSDTHDKSGMTYLEKGLAYYDGVGRVALTASIFPSLFPADSSSLVEGTRPKRELSLPLLPLPRPRPRPRPRPLPLLGWWPPRVQLPEPILSGETGLLGLEGPSPSALSSADTG